MAWIAPAAAGLGALPVDLVASPGAGMAGLAAAAVFAAILGALVPFAAADEARTERLDIGIARRSGLLCAAALAAMALLSAALTYKVWTSVGPTSALGLAAVTLAFAMGAVGIAGEVLRRR
ncbi:hypothetical protein [Falsiroseomonas oryzae]|uniref:hypothetical protein n=1 Tax=Falsiroseomonas oryzae TaxID=2766473 RepID=UPI0022EA980E|nr:hypothetical protein [Roseomonas sp. MO-31]